MIYGARGQAGDDAPLEEQHHDDQRDGDDGPGGHHGGVGLLVGLDPAEPAIATVTGATAALPLDRRLDRRYSFQAEMKTRIAVVNRAGAASGRMTSRNAWAGVQPSMPAACSSF